MAIPDWPAEVTQDVLRQGFTEVDDDYVERFKPEKGPEITWGSPSAFTTLYRITVPCNSPAKRILRDFHRNNCASQFRRLDPSTGETARFTFVTPISWVEVSPNLWHGSTSIRRMP